MRHHLAKKPKSNTENTGIKLHMVEPFENPEAKPDTFKQWIFKRMGSNQAEVQRKRQRTEGFIDALGKYE